MIGKLIPDKYKKWSTLIGGILIHFALGSGYTFPNMTPYITSYLRECAASSVRYSDSIWITTAWALCSAATSFLAGLIISKFKISLKLITFVGCLLMSLSIALTFFTIKMSFTLTMLSYGALSGIGTGLAYLPPLGIAMKWFDNSKGFANSAILFGYGASGIAFNQIETLYINPNNYSPDEPYSDKFPDEKYFSKKYMSLLERIPNSFLLLSGIFLALQLVGIVLIFEKPDSKFQATSENENENSTSGINNSDIERASETDSLISSSINNTTIEYNSLGVNINDGIDVGQVIRKPAFYMMCLMMALSQIGSGLVISFYKTFGQTFINSDEFLATVGSFASLFNSFGRLFWGFLIDKISFKVCYLILATILVSLTSTLYLTNYMFIKEMYLIWICLIYGANCGMFVIFPTAITKCFGLKHFTSLYSLILLSLIPTTFVTTFLGENVNTIGWFWLFTIGSILGLIGWILGMFFNVTNSNGSEI